MSTEHPPCAPHCSGCLKEDKTQPSRYSAFARTHGVLGTQRGSVNSACRYVVQDDTELKCRLSLRNKQELAREKGD